MAVFLMKTLCAHERVLDFPRVKEKANDILIENRFF